jgi:RNA polymerase sigma-70 factor (ECF subfamily)
MAEGTGKEKEARERVLRLLVEHRDEIFAFILSLVRDAAAAEDIMQDVAVVVCDRWQQFTIGTDFGKWARQIARYKILTERDGRLRSMKLLSEEAIESVGAAFDEEESSSRDELSALRECMRRLGRKARSLVRLRYTEGHDCSRVAEKMGMSLGSVYMGLSRARVALADCVEQRLTDRRG